MPSLFPPSTCSTSLSTISNPLKAVSNDRPTRRKWRSWKKCQEALESEIPLHDIELDQTELKMLSGLRQLASQKPCVPHHQGRCQQETWILDALSYVQELFRCLTGWLDLSSHAIIPGQSHQHRKEFGGIAHLAAERVRPRVSDRGFWRGKAQALSTLSHLFPNFFILLRVAGTANICKRFLAPSYLAIGRMILRQCYRRHHD